MSTKSIVVGPENEQITLVQDENDQINPVQNIVMDYTDLFTTHELFSSRQKLFEWARASERENGIVIIISRSDSGAGKERGRLLLTCERSGEYCEKKKVAA